MYILGISAFYHDSAAAILHDDSILAAAQEERFTRKKHDSSFPINAVKYCLEYAGVSLTQLDAVVFYDKPFLKFERLLETYYAFAPRGLRSFLRAMPIWIKEKILLKHIILTELKSIEPIKEDDIKLLFPEHHLSHAASAFFPSPYDQAAIITIDGVGEWATASICRGNGNQIEIIRELHFPHSVGLLYSAFTYYLGFRVNSGEYKLMGLAPYGNPQSSQVAKYEKLICENIVDIAPDGSIWLNQKYFNYATGLTMANDSKWQKLFGLPKRTPESELLQEHCDLAMAIQRVTEKIVLAMAEYAKELTKCRYLCLAGGVALNCVANGKLLGSGIFEDIWIQPAAGDAGGAVGGAYAAYHIYFQQERNANSNSDRMAGAYLGPEFTDHDIEKAARRFDANYNHHDEDTLIARVAKLLADGKIVGWFQGQMEWGPRALGNRSILGDARDSDMQKRLNLQIKYRESFRPFAPSVLYEDIAEYFETHKPSPYMLLVTNVNKSRCNALPGGCDYYEQSLRDRLYFTRSDVPAITHLDYSARLQTVHADTNPIYHKLISKFKEYTGHSLIVNTSFNVRGEPIVCTPQDAYKCFMRTEMEYLVIGNYLFDKAKQPEWTEQKNWREEYVLD